MSLKQKTTSIQAIAKYPNQPAYQPIPSTAMDNPAMTASTRTTRRNPADDSDRGSMEGVGLPSTYSSQQLMPPSDSDSMVEGGHLRGGSENPRLRALGQSHWFTVAVLCFVNLINYMDRFTIAGVLSDIQEDFSIGDDDGGLLQTVFVISYMICAPIFGYLGDRYSRRWIMAVGVFLWSSTTLLGSFMNSFRWFITFRALVGIGEASYSTIAPTIISDLFVNDLRSKMLAVFYFAIPVGSGFGYIVGSETARLADNWRWALRVTPILGIIAVLLILLIKDPARGESEGSHNLEVTTYKKDIKYLVKNRSFMFSTAGFTCVAFVAGALSWWAPKFMYLGMRNQAGNENLTINDVSYKFGIVAMVAGLIGVPMGSVLAQRLRSTVQNCDPYICAFGLLISAPMAFLSLLLPQTNATLCFVFVFLAQITLNMCWSIVADILLYVVVPTRRSTAEAFQILISHALGDAGSPYLVGVISEAIKAHLRVDYVHLAMAKNASDLESYALTLENYTVTTTLAPSAFLSADQDTNQVKFTALQYALFSTSFIEVLGGIFFLITAAFIIRDKELASRVSFDSSFTAPDQRRRVEID